MGRARHRLRKSGRREQVQEVFRFRILGNGFRASHGLYNLKRNPQHCCGQVSKAGVTTLGVAQCSTLLQKDVVPQCKYEYVVLKERRIPI